MTETNRLFEELSIGVKGQLERPRMSVVIDRPGELRVACEPNGSLELLGDGDGVRGTLSWTHREDDDAPHKVRVKRDGGAIGVWWNGTPSEAPATVQTLASSLLETLRVHCADVD